MPCIGFKRWQPCASHVHGRCQQGCCGRLTGRRSARCGLPACPNRRGAARARCGLPACPTLHGSCHARWDPRRARCGPAALPTWQPGSSPCKSSGHCRACCPPLCWRASCGRRRDCCGQRPARCGPRHARCDLDAPLPAPLTPAPRSCGRRRGGCPRARRARCAPPPPAPSRRARCGHGMLRRRARWGLEQSASAAGGRTASAKRCQWQQGERRWRGGAWCTATAQALSADLRGEPPRAERDCVLCATRLTAPHSNLRPSLPAAGRRQCAPALSA